MEITKDTPAKEISVKGVTLAVPAPYAEGHTLAANEAAVLNQTLAENLRNNFSRKVTEAIEAAGGNAESVDTKALQKDFNEYISEYEFGVRRTGSSGPKLSPEEREAFNLAKEKVKDAIRTNGKKVSDFPTAKINELATNLVEQDPFYKEEAARRVKAKQKAAADSIDLSGLSEAA